MSVPPQSTTLSSFLSSTTPPKPASLPSLWTYFYEPSAFAVPVEILHLDHSSTEYFAPTLSALSLPGFQYSESVPPHDRPPLWTAIQQIRIGFETRFDEDSWLAVMWRPASRIPAEALDGSVLVYYCLDLAQTDTKLGVLGLLGSRITSDWLKSATADQTARAGEFYSAMCQKASEVAIRSGISHHDNTYIVSRGLHILQ